MARILIDLDGTLIDSDPFCLAKGEEALRQMGLKYTSSDIASSLACNLYLNTLSPQTRAEFWRVFDALDTRWTHIEPVITLFPDTIMFLRALRNLPFIITNTPHVKAWNEVRHFGLDKYVAGMECAMGGNGKPKPNIALEALDKMQGNGPIFIIGDTECDTELVSKLQPLVQTPVLGIHVQRHPGISIPCDYRANSLIEVLAHIKY